MGHEAPLIVHIVHQLATGGMENGVANLLNTMPSTRYRHAIICLKNYTEFRKRLKGEIQVFELGKRDGTDLPTYVRLLRLLRRLSPTIVHTRTWAALDCHYYAFVAGVPCRVHSDHSEHLGEEGLLHLLLRKAAELLIDEYVTVNDNLASWLMNEAAVDKARIHRIYNGVDTIRFRPHSGRSAQGFTIGYVGRMEAIKDPLNLAHAFIRLVHETPEYRSRLRLVMVGDGSLREPMSRLLGEAGVADMVRFTGERRDTENYLREMDLLVVPSRSEGTCNAILEAMATGLPVVATRVGGNPELVVEGQTGLLLPPSNPAALARGIRRYIEDGPMCQTHGSAARLRAEQMFSMDCMVKGYLSVYDSLMKRKCPRRVPPAEGNSATSVS